MAFDVAAARAAGYTDAEIAKHLAKQDNYDLSGAKKNGYTDAEVIAHLANKPAPAYTQIPVEPGANTKTTPEVPTTLAEKAIGTGEAALTTLTGATGGTVGMIAGTLKGLAEQILSGNFGTPEAAKLVEQSAMSGAQALTYEPRTPSGQAQAQAVGEVMQNVIPVAPVLPGLMPAAGARNVAPARVVGRASAESAGRAVAGERGAAAVSGGLDASARTLQVAADSARGVIERLRPKEQPQPAARFGSVGSAAAEVAGQRAATAEALPVPIRLTKGQATRDFEALRFEGETAKNPALGAPLRENSARQNAALAQNIESMIESTGAKATSAIETGRAVDTALVTSAARAKAQYRAKYKAAEKAGQMEDPVNTQPLIDFLTENASANAPELAGGTLGIAQRELIRLGGARMVDGRLVAGELPLKQVELVRRQVGNAMDAAPANATNMRMGVMLREVIDQQTEGLGGDLYKGARSARRRYGQLFEDNAIVSNLLRTRKGTADRNVALEDVFKKTILNGDRESIGKLRRTLQVAGGEEGKQAWKELQGATAKHLLDEATSGSATDSASNPIFSAAKFNNAVRALDTDGRLDFVLSKKGAQTIRDLNEISKVVMTTPPGAVNTSNTASVLLWAALAETGANGALTGLPIPVLTGLRVLTQQVKDRRIRQRVSEALGEAHRLQLQAGIPKTPAGTTIH